MVWSLSSVHAATVAVVLAGEAGWQGLRGFFPCLKYTTHTHTHTHTLIYWIDEVGGLSELIFMTYILVFLSLSLSLSLSL